MEAEAILNLFDSRWFYHLQKQSQISSSSKPDREILRQSSSSQLAATIETKPCIAPSPLEIPKAPQIIMKKKWLSKSLSELEFEELKGFTDLGFVFSEQDKDDSHLVEMIPGLQKQKVEGNNELILLRATIRPRPYLSQAWEYCYEESQLMKWRVPAHVNDIDMKDSLKWWAHTVASSVR